MSRPTKIAILGGGCGAMAALWGLMQSDRADDYEITVYQMGWRLGGKCASGRNREHHDRIEEHGLHIWGGTYENAFRMMRSVYRQLDRPERKPLSRWYDPEHPESSAFLPHNVLTLPEYVDGDWVPWTFEMPPNSELPGDGRLLPEPAAFVEEVLESLIAAVWHTGFLNVLDKPAHRLRGWMPGLVRGGVDAITATLRASPVLEGLERLARVPLHHLQLRHLHAARHAAAQLPSDHREHTAAHYTAILEPLGHFRAWFEGAFTGLIDELPHLKRLYLILDLGTTLVRGVVADELMSRGIDSIDDLEFSGWLEQHGASRMTLDSVLVRGWYSFFFATPEGPGGPLSMSAATGLRTLFRYVFTYKGAFFWKMQAGMGDTVFAPIYELYSRDQRVRFEFFHKVESLHVDTDAHGRLEISSVRMARQVDLAEDRDHYAPLFDVGGLPCWPSEPLYEQLDPRQARKLKKRGVDLESHWAEWEPRERFTLDKGQDFDVVVLGIPPAALKSLTRDLGRAHKPWRRMLRSLPSVQTQAMQLWLDPTKKALGWTGGSTVCTEFAHPFNTWADMDHLLERESWHDSTLRPRSLLYFCDTAADAQPIPSSSDAGFPLRQHERVRDAALSWLMSNPGALWPGMARADTPALDFSLLTADPDRSGGQRFDQQYWRINIDPSQRYVLSVPGTASHRVRSEQSGFGNLFLAGDWLATGLNAGCVEAAVMGGLQASRAISGWPREIVGDGDLLRHPEATATSRRVELPRDDGVIDDVLVQWWYWTGQLESSSGQHFGFEIVFFVVEALRDFAAATMGQAAVSDLTVSRFVGREIELPGRPAPTPGRFDLDVGEIRASGGNGMDHISSVVDGYEVDLDVRALRPPTIHYQGRDHRYAFGGDTWYYSRPLMAAEGTIVTPDGETHQVSGKVWFDRQWGELVPAVLNGWQWFAIQLDNDVQIMLFAFIDRPEEWMGSMTLADETVVPLTAQQFGVEILDWWTSPHTGHRYPHGWRVDVPGEELVIRPRMADQEMTAPFWVGPRYWEGACSVEGTTSGNAYVELTGFTAVSTASAC